LGILAKGRNVTEAGASYQLRVPANSYTHYFGDEKVDIRRGNGYFGNINI